MKTEDFHKFMDEPMVRLATSSLGEAAKSEPFTLLLSAAFDAGFRSGTGDAIEDIMGALMNGLLKDKKDKAS